MAQHVGIVACSAEGAALCYRTIALEAQKEMGEHAHPRVTLDSIPMAEHLALIDRGDWSGVAGLMSDSMERLKRAGAAFAICPDNTLHQAMTHLLPRAPIPFLSIADVVALEASRRGFRKLAVLGTRYLMESGVYPAALEAHGIVWEIPDREARHEINRIIFKELCQGSFPEASRLYLNGVMEAAKARGCDAAILGCTELPLIVRAEDAPLPTLDSTRLLARAAIARAIDGDGGPA